jgi:hypothetical protein
MPTTGLGAADLAAWSGIYGPLFVVEAALVKLLAPAARSCWPE